MTNDQSDVLTYVRSGDVWKSMSTDRLYMVYGPVSSAGSGYTVSPHDDTNAEPVYRPVTHIPHAILCRTSDSVKRVDGDIHLRRVTTDEYGVEAYEVSGLGGAVVGCAVIVLPGPWVAAYCTPDGAHLVRWGGDGRVTAADPREYVVSDVYDHKTMKVFAIGPRGYKDVFVTAKTRWFRARNNPKYLGFSKDKI